jgi:hypothetical protein
LDPFNSCLPIVLKFSVIATLAVGMPFMKGVLRKTEADMDFLLEDEMRHTHFYEEREIIRS